MTIYMLKIIAQRFVFSPCFNLIVKWTPEAIQAVNIGLNETIDYCQPCISCSSEVVKKWEEPKKNQLWLQVLPEELD